MGTLLFKKSIRLPIILKIHLSLNYFRTWKLKFWSWDLWTFVQAAVINLLATYQFISMWKEHLSFQFKRLKHGASPIKDQLLVHQPLIVKVAKYSCVGVRMIIFCMSYLFVSINFHCSLGHEYKSSLIMEIISKTLDFTYYIIC